MTVSASGLSSAGSCHTPPVYTLRKPPPLSSSILTPTVGRAKQVVRSGAPDVSFSRMYSWIEHLTHWPRPASGCTVPCGHGVQLLLLPSLNVPGGHSNSSVVGSPLIVVVTRRMPGLYSSQKCLPASSWCFPLGQEIHCIWSTSGWYWPRTQSSQVEWSLIYLPGEHAAQ